MNSAPINKHVTLNCSTVFVIWMRNYSKSKYVLHCTRKGLHKGRSKLVYCGIVFTVANAKSRFKILLLLQPTVYFTKCLLYLPFQCTGTDVHLPGATSESWLLSEVPCKQCTCNTVKALETLLDPPAKFILGWLGPFHV